MTWLPIETFDKTKAQVVLVCQDKAVRLYYWNPVCFCWEHLLMRNGFLSVEFQDECSDPTHWMECPEGI